jgi:hypothetical protein
MLSLVVRAEQKAVRARDETILQEVRDMKFRKKPVVIEATQWFKDGDHPHVLMCWFDAWGKVR